jgi:hypothetical protein
MREIKNWLIKSKNIKILIRLSMLIPLVCFALIEWKSESKAAWLIELIQFLVFIEFILLISIFIFIILGRRSKDK